MTDLYTANERDMMTRTMSCSCWFQLRFADFLKRTHAGMVSGHLSLSEPWIRCAAEPIGVVGAKMSGGFVNSVTNVMGTAGVRYLESHPCNPC